MQTIINSQLPEFSVQAFQNGQFKTVTDKDVKGKWGIFFFYPADFTFVCPTELVDMAEKYEQFQAMGVEIYSVSTDSHFVHKACHGQKALEHPAGGVLPGHGQCCDIFLI